MPASTIATDVRGAIKTALAACAANIYDSVPEAPIVPAIVIVPDSPYMELELIGKSTTRVKLNYTITACVAYFSNAAALDNLEQLIISILGELDASKYELSTVERPTVTEVGTTTLLVSDIRLSVRYEQTAQETQMPTTVITGRDVTFTLDSASYDAQATSATLACETIIETYQTLDGRAYKSTDKQWTFTIELLQDWGAASSLFEAMWADAESAPNTTLPVSFTAVTGAVFAFNVLPIFPTAGGAAPSALTDTWTMTVVGTPTETFS